MMNLFYYCCVRKEKKEPLVSEIYGIKNKSSVMNEQKNPMHIKQNEMVEYVVG